MLFRHARFVKDVLTAKKTSEEEYGGDEESRSRQLIPFNAVNEGEHEKYPKDGTHQPVVAKRGPNGT